jgi:hypothetical protein
VLLTVLGVVVLFGLVAALAVVMIGTPPDEDAQRFVPVGSSLPDRPPPDDPDEPEEATTTEPEPRWIEGLPPLPERESSEVPGADPTDFCLSGPEYAMATGRPFDPVTPPWVRPSAPAEAGTWRFEMSACDYLNQGVIALVPDPDGVVLDAIRRSPETGGGVAVIGGREYVTSIGGPGTSVDGGRRIGLAFAIDGTTYTVAVTDGPDVSCPIACAARVAELVVARVS